MRVNVKSGTRSDSQTLCRSCRSSTVVRGAAESQEFVRCDELEQVIPFPVVECSGYDNRNETTLWDMQRIAWVIDGNKRRVGFMPPEQWRDKNPERDPLDGF